MASVTNGAFGTQTSDHTSDVYITSAFFNNCIIIEILHKIIKRPSTRLYHITVTDVIVDLIHCAFSEQTTINNIETSIMFKKLKILRKYFNIHRKDLQNGCIVLDMQYCLKRYLTFCVYCSLPIVYKVFCLLNQRFNLIFSSQTSILLYIFSYAFPF